MLGGLIVSDVINFCLRRVIIPKVGLGLEVVVYAACTMDYYFFAGLQDWR